MTSSEAVERIKAVQTGKGLPWWFALETMGVIALQSWHDPLFNYGREYGYIQGIAEAAGISSDELAEILAHGKDPVVVEPQESEQAVTKQKDKAGEDV
jgi:hypothetical protein